MQDKKVLCFGELLLRMSPQTDGQWLIRNNVPVFVGGAELNVASALANWGIPVKYFTALPDTSLSKELLHYLTERNIDVSSVKISGDRIGIYFLPQGKDLKNEGVIYDRAHSSFSELKSEMIDWDELLHDVSWVHLSAINPALNEDVARLCLDLVKIASAKSILVSLDLNYRSKLWKYGKKPVEIMPGIAQYCDLIMGNIWAAEDLLDIKVDAKILKDRNKSACIEHALYTSKAIKEKFPKVKYIANTFRFDRSEKEVHYYGAIYENNNLIVSDEFNASGICDKIGSGDCFMAGLLFGLYKEMSLSDMINFSAASAVGKMFETSDATRQTTESILIRILKNQSIHENK